MESSTTNTLSEVLAVGLTGVVIILVSSIVGIIFYLVPVIINDYILFKKSNQNKWAALIPFYSIYVFGIISKRSKLLVWATLMSPVLYNLLTVVSFVLIFPVFRGSYIIAFFLFSHQKTPCF